MILNERTTSSAEISCLLWSDRQIAAAIGMSVKRVQALARLGLLPGFKLGKHWRFDPDEVRSWVKGNGRTKKARPNNDRAS
jgi:hypothetical protein